MLFGNPKTISYDFQKANKAQGFREMDKKRTDEFKESQIVPE